MYGLSVCAETVFRHLPFKDRVREIAAEGFQVEFWRWDHHDLNELAGIPNLKISNFVGSMRGSMVHPDGVELFLNGVKSCLPVAEKLGCGKLILLAGELGPKGEAAHPVAANPAIRWITAYKTLCRVAELAEKANVVFCLEHLNTNVDHSNYPLPHVEDALHLVSEVGSSKIRVLLDLYHAQVQEGNLIEKIKLCQPFLGHVHVADVPGRHEPGTGEIDYGQIAQTLSTINYSGNVGLEAFPIADDRSALKSFRRIFS
ncbi:MAG: TIM barrel protein [Terriglobia bacterium]